MSKNGNNDVNMSFYDLPTVDENSKISEESVLTIRQLFTRRNGYILRIEDPDYGCDVTLEIVTESSKASGCKFSGQIKSSANLNYIQVEGQQYLSLSFPTSTLGYLCKQLPAYGIILVYDDNTKQCYFDYVEETVNRLILQRESEEWKNQKTVSIHLPIENILNEQTLASIHERILNRFKAYNSLIQQFGSRFDIPNLSGIKKGGTFEKLSAADLLKKYGSILLNDHDILRLYKLLSDASFQEILLSKDLILIAASVYSEMGKCLEGEFYLNKSDQIIDQFTQEEVEILKFTRIKVDFLLGKRSRKQYYEDLKSMKAVTSQVHNAIQIQINLFYYDILEQIELNEFREQTEHELMQLFSAIDEAELSERQKHLYKVFHSENLHMYVSSRMLKYVNRLRIRESLGEDVSLRERVGAMDSTNSQLYFLTLTVIQAYQYSKKSENIFLQAHCLYVLSRFFFTKEFNFMLLDFHDNNSSLKENYCRFFLKAIKAHNLFFELGLLKEAYLALQNALELNRISKLWHNFDITTETTREEILWNNIRAAEKEMAVSKPYASSVDEAYENKQKSANNDTGAFFENLSEDQFELFASTVLEIYNLPDERRIHIVNEIKSYKYFHEHCDTDNFQLLCYLEPHQNIKTKYADPTKFILVSKRTGIESQSSTNVAELAKSFGALKK